MHNYAKFSELVGKTISDIKVTDEEIVFVCSDKTYKQYHRQDCCEYVRVESIEGDLSSFIGNTIVQADEESQDGKHDDWGDTSTWTFYRLADDKGHYSVIRWLGESNGYYSESVDFVIIE